MKSLYKIWWISLFVKLLLAAIIPLSADEAYYWVWGQRLQLSYFDHPPLVSWLTYLGNNLSFLGHAVRWPAVLLGHCMILFWIDIFRDKISIEKNQTLIYLILFSPLLGFGSLIVTPDLPVIFFWSAAIWSCLRIFENQKLIDYALFGAFLGLGFLSKYHIVLFIPCLLFYLTFEKRWSEVKLLGVALTVLFGFIFSLPVLIWNYQNDFQSFMFQINHGFTRPNYKFSWTSTYLLGQLLIIFPPILWAAFKVRVPKQFKFLSYCAWVPLAFFFMTSFKALVEANWPIIAYPAVLALAAISDLSKKTLKIYMAFWGTIVALVLATLFIPQLRSLNKKISEPYVFQEIAHEVLGYNPLYGNSYQMSSSLWYFRKDPVFKLSGISRYDYFDTFPEAKPQGSEFYLVRKQGQQIPEWLSTEGWQAEKIKDLKESFELIHLKR